MSIAPLDPTEAAPAPMPAVARRPFRRRVMHVVRRGHLYLGLFLLPWAVLYGVTGFLFNHPTAFSDQPTTAFGPAELAGTPMASPPPPADTAARVVDGLRARNPDASYALVDPEKAAYAREFASATVTAGDRQVSVVVDVRGHGGTVRGGSRPPPAESVKAPFAVGGGGPGRAARGGSPKGGMGTGSDRGEAGRPPASAGLTLDAPLHDRVKGAVPVVLERTGYPGGEVTVTGVPDLTFLMDADGTLWKVSYNSLTGAVAGVPAGSGGEELSTRRFLTRLHMSHGYPGDPNARWFWAVIVDLMAFVMVFWGVSGVFMWWQIKATRTTGILILILSVAAATALGLGMHDLLSSARR